MSDSDILLQAENIGYRHRERLLFAAQNILVHRQECLYVQGANGIGKTSLLKILASLLVPETGHVARFCTGIAYIGHDNALTEELTVLEHLQFWRALEKSPTPQRHKDLTELTQHWFGDTHILKQSVRFCSAGECRKLSLMRLCFNHHRLWLLDEPLVSVDSIGGKAFTAVLQQHCAAGGSAIISGHNEPDYIKNLGCPWRHHTWNRPHYV